jgi:DNA-binding transcriptional regulator/RsmH inhibitor MraZ
VNDGEGYLLIPKKYREHFTSSRIKVLFDPTNNLLALVPSTETDDYQSRRWRLWCTPFIREYSLHSQKIQVEWDKKRKFLLGKVER